MKKSIIIKKIIASALALAMVLALAACGGSGGSGSAGGNSSSDSGSQTTAVQPKKAKIGIALYSDSGNGVTATKAYLASLEETLNVSFAYTVLSTNDEAVNLTKIQELIAAGCDGIICTMDMSMDSILSECEAANVYLAGYLCDYDDSFRNNYDNVFKHPYFLGTVADGGCGNDIKRGYDFYDSLIEYNESHPDDPVTHVAMCTFPAFAFPYQQEYVAQFQEKIAEYNSSNPDKAITVDDFNEETDILFFSPMDSTYFTKHEGIDGIMSFCSGTFVYPSMVAAGVNNDLKLFAAGYNDGDNEVFGSKGAFQQEIVCGVESITYPLVLLLNKINDVEFPDMPADAERRSCSTYIINSDEDMALFEKSIYLTGKAEDAMLTPQDVLNLTAFGNENATYADLVAILDHLTVEDLK